MRCCSSATRRSPCTARNSSNILETLGTFRPATRGSHCTARNSSNMLETLGTFSTCQPLFATFYFLPTETLFLLDCAQKLRQAASVNEPIFVDVENHCAVINATNMILDFAIIVLHSQSLQKRNFEMKTPIA